MSPPSYLMKCVIVRGLETQTAGVVLEETGPEVWKVLDWPGWLQTNLLDVAQPDSWWESSLRLEVDKATVRSSVSAHRYSTRCHCRWAPFNLWKNAFLSVSNLRHPKYWPGTANTKHVCEETQNKDASFFVLQTNMCAKTILTFEYIWLASPKFQVFAQSPRVMLLWTEFCMDHWKEDWFFGYQCLNGSNPRMIKRCKKLPDNFPVTPELVQKSMAPGTNLDQELKVEPLLKCLFIFCLSN